MVRNIYLQMKTLPEARAVWTGRTSMFRTREEELPATSCLHRVTSRPLTAKRSVPHYHGAAMDGFAVAAAQTFGASDAAPARLRLGISSFPVDTGDPLPAGTDAVIMIEQTEQISEDVIEIRSAAFPWQHVRKVGEDIVAGELLLAAQHELRPADLGSLLAGGILRVHVFSRPYVRIHPTGTELIPASRSCEAVPGDIIEFNGTVLAGLVEECGGIPELCDIVADDYEIVRKTIREAVDSPADVVLVNAGSSAGSEDYTAAVIAELGEILVHGVAMMPGKPVILGIIKGKPVVGIPGYPVSAVMAFEQFVRPLVYSLRGISAPEFPSVNAMLCRKTPSRLGLEEFARVILGRVETGSLPCPFRGVRES